MLPATCGLLTCLCFVVDLDYVDFVVCTLAFVWYLYADSVLLVCYLI